MNKYVSPIMELEKLYVEDIMINSQGTINPGEDDDELPVVRSSKPSSTYFDK